MFYKFDDDDLTWKKDWKRTIFIIIAIIFLMLFSFIFGTYNRFDNLEEFRKSINSYKPPVEPHVEYIDSLFLDYEKRANFYLLNKFKDSPIKGYMLATSAKDAYLSTGVFLPVELALAQAQIESGMGMVGRTPDKNPFNIGEYDTHTEMRFKNTYEGVNAYYKYMTSNYLSCKPIDILLKNFTNCNGYRYASKQNYEEELSNLYLYIVKYTSVKD
jgi:hypothetical protein